MAVLPAWLSCWCSDDQTGLVMGGCGFKSRSGQTYNKHNKKVTNADNDTNTDNQVQCNCRNKDQCPLDNKCLTSSVIYKAQVTTNNGTKNYMALTEGTFKQGFSQHKATFKHRKYTNSTELFKYIWKLCDNNQDFNIKINGL